jgi:hypothetical protein
VNLVGSYYTDDSKRRKQTNSFISYYVRLEGTKVTCHEGRCITQSRLELTIGLIIFPRNMTDAWRMQQIFLEIAFKDENDLKTQREDIRSYNRVLNPVLHTAAQRKYKYSLLYVYLTQYVSGTGSVHVCRLAFSKTKCYHIIIIDTLIRPEQL